MKKIGSRGMKILKTCHLFTVMIWTVGVISMAIINLIESQSGDELYMTLYISRFIDDVLVIPGAILTLVTAIVYGVFTNWGFFKHKWITVKWIISVFVILAGTFYFSPRLDKSLQIVDTFRNEAFSNSELISNSQVSLFGAFIQAGLLVFLVIVSVFKPWKKKKELNQSKK